MSTPVISFTRAVLGIIIKREYAERACFFLGSGIGGSETSKRLGAGTGESL